MYILAFSFRWLTVFFKSTSTLKVISFSWLPSHALFHCVIAGSPNAAHKESIAGRLLRVENEAKDFSVGFTSPMTEIENKRIKWGGCQNRYMQFYSIE